jgi:parvulin-like peptidyl-prolyl isomerase
MRKFTWGAAALVLGTALSATAAGQAPVAPPATPPMTPPTQPMTPPGAAPVVPLLTPAAPVAEVRPTGIAATVNGQNIMEVEVYRHLRQFPPQNRELARKEILAHLIDQVIIDQYLTAIKIVVDPKEIDANIADMKTECLKDKRDYHKELAAMMLTEAEFRECVVVMMKWDKFFHTMGTEQELKKLFDGNPDFFDGTMVRVRHILLNPGTDPAKQKEADGKLLGIKQRVLEEAAKAVAALPPTATALDKEQARANKTEELFGLYAKEYSVCPSKAQGGDLQYFPRAGAMVEPFAKAAYAIKPFEMTDVVVTEFGHHLILVTARKQGSPKKYEEVKEDVKYIYNLRLKEAVIEAMKPKAKVTINPTPAN